MVVFDRKQIGDKKCYQQQEKKSTARLEVDSKNAVDEEVGDESH